MGRWIILQTHLERHGYEGTIDNYLKTRQGTYDHIHKESGYIILLVRYPL